MTGNDLTNAVVSGFNDIMYWLETIPCRFGRHAWKPSTRGRKFNWEHCRRCGEVRWDGMLT